MGIPMETIDALRAKFDALLPHLDERAQRLTLAAEARSLGHGGIAAVARASGSAKSRVQRGVAELESGEQPSGRVRRPGAGRKPITRLILAWWTRCCPWWSRPGEETRNRRCAGRRCR